MMASAALQQRTAKLLTEFLGTAFLCLTVATAGRFGANAPIAIGCALMVAVYAGGHVSGGHYNPAVTLAVLVRGGGKICPVDACAYVLSQLLGALCAAALSWSLVGRNAAAHARVADGAHPLSACLCEATITFALCSVVLHTATTKAQDGNSHFGLAIGFTVLSGAASVGRISGGAFNPAVGSMSLLYGADAASSAWIYWVAPVLGGLAAGAAFRVVAWREFAETAGDALTVLAPCLVEMVGTMLLCFTVGTAAGSPTPLTALSIGSMLMVVIYVGGWISGGHYNPAVTLAVLLRSLFGATHGPFTWLQAARYVVAQVAGAALGTFAAWGAVGSSGGVGYPSLPASSSVGQGILGEVLGTFLLAYMVLNVATAKRVEGNSYFGLAIGMTVTAMACAIGPVTGGAFNPAVGMMGLFVSGSAADFWLYWLACSLGAVLAAGCFRIQNFQDFGAVEEGQQVAKGDPQPAKQHDGGAQEERDIQAEV